MANPSFIIQSQFKDFIQATIVVMPDYSEVKLEDLDIEAWRNELLNLTAEKLNDSVETLKNGQKQLITNQILNLQARLNALNNVQEEEEQAIVETTPAIIDKKKRSSKLPDPDDDDSAIVETKSPQQLKKEQEESLQEYLSKLP